MSFKLSSITCGYLNQSNGNGSGTFGIFARADSDCSYAIGENVRAYNKGQFSKTGGAFATQGDSQQTLINTSKSASIGSTGTTILSTLSNGGAGDIELLGNNRVFKVKCLWATMVSVSGGGGSDPIVGDVFAQELDFTFKKVGGVLTQVGTTTTTSTENDASMTGASLTLSVASNKLRITFNAPTTTGNNTYNTNACLYITEVAF
jgi:hypothetical protein